MDKVINMNVNAELIVWIQSFLPNRLQYVNFNGTLLDVIEINTGAPQGCVLSAVHNLKFSLLSCNLLLCNCTLNFYFSLFRNRILDLTMDLF